MFANPQVTAGRRPSTRRRCCSSSSTTAAIGPARSTVQRTFPEGYAAKDNDFTGGWFDPCPNYSGEAAASGAYGEKVTDPNEVSAAIRRGVEAVKKGSPAVLDMWLPKLLTGEV